MKIGGLQPVTLLDYPGKVAAIIFASGCNMRCPFCYNSRLVLPEQIKKSHFLSTQKAWAFLKKRKKYLDGVVLTGGEPTIQAGLFGFLKKLKKIGYLIKLDTNGLRPEILKKLIKEGLVDYVAMDIKGPLAKYEKWCGVRINADKIKASVKIIKNGGLPYEFRSTIIKGLHERADVKIMAQLIKGAKKYYLQNFNPKADLVDKNFKGKPFTAREMGEFRRVADKYVEECRIR